MMSRFAVVALVLALSAPAFAFRAQVDIPASGSLPYGSVIFKQDGLHGDTDITVDLMNVGDAVLSWNITSSCSDKMAFVQGEANGMIPVAIGDGQKMYRDVEHLPVTGVDTIVGRFLRISWDGMAAPACGQIYPVPFVHDSQMENSAKAGFLVAFTIVVFCFGCLVAGILKVNHELSLVKAKIGYHGDI